MGGNRKSGEKHMAPVQMHLFGAVVRCVLCIYHPVQTPEMHMAFGNRSRCHMVIQ